MFSQLRSRFIVANWAQTVGIKAQNNAEVPKQFFSPRHGHAITKVELTDEEKYISAGAESMLFVLGGDSMDVDVGGGGYKNDVWISKGPFVGDFGNRLAIPIFILHAKITFFSFLRIAFLCSYCTLPQK